MTDAVQLITERVRERVRARDRGGARGDVGEPRRGRSATVHGSASSRGAAEDRESTARLVHEEIRRYSERALTGALPQLADEEEAARSILATITGYGPLQPYFDDPEIEEIWINRPDRVFVARNGVSERTGVRLSAGQVRDLVERMLQSTGRRVDHASPFVDASLPDGSRLHESERKRM